MFEFIVGYFSFCHFECNEYFIFYFEILNMVCLLIVMSYLFVTTTHYQKTFLHIRLTGSFVPKCVSKP